MDLSVGTDISIHPSGLNLNIRKTVGYNNKILINNMGMKIDSNRIINKALVYHYKSIQNRSPVAELELHTASEIYVLKRLDKPLKHPETIGNQKALAGMMNNDE